MIAFTIALDHGDDVALLERLRSRRFDEFGGEDAFLRDVDSLDFRRLLDILGALPLDALASDPESLAGRDNAIFL